MALPPVIKTWTFAPNNRIPFVTLNDMMSKFLFGLKTFLVTTMGYTVKYSSNGVAGPSGVGDHTDRWLSAANCTTRGTTAASAQSMIVLTDGNGVDFCFGYSGSTDDLCVFKFSPGAKYVPAGTPTAQATAVDEQTIIPAATSVIGNATSNDRVWHAMATTDQTLFRFFIYRADVMQYSGGIELIVSTCTAKTNFTPPVVGWASNNSSLTAPSAGHVLHIGAAGNGGFAFVNSTNVVCGGCGESYLGGVANPIGIELQAGAVIVSVGFATNTVGAAGKLGNRIDCWYAYNTPTPGQGDSLGDLTHVLFGTGVWPWDGITFPEIT